MVMFVQAVLEIGQLSLEASYQILHTQVLQALPLTRWWVYHGVISLSVLLIGCMTKLGRKPAFYGLCD